MLERSRRAGGGEIRETLKLILGCADRISRADSLDQARDYGRAIHGETVRALRRGDRTRAGEKKKEMGAREETGRTVHGGTFSGPPSPPVFLFQETAQAVPEEMGRAPRTDEAPEGTRMGDLADRINRIREALAARDDALARTETLALREGALGLAAGSLAAEALRLERALRENGTADAEAAFAGIEVRFHELDRAAPAWTPAPSGGDVKIPSGR
ncbi:MAG: hypothetical protein JW958_09780 [Candidatus Eisenbacteria bacterium]|nr:hypothetical protein [Candidatus Eisenbacteria bacterium]